LLIFVFKRKFGISSIRFSSVKLFNGIKPSFKYRLRNIPFVLFLLAIVLLLIALARPRIGSNPIYSEGIAIQMILDRSSSMIEERLMVGNNVVTYFDAAKNVAKDFIVGSSALNGRPNDAIGFSSFAGFSQENCPLTLDHTNLARIIDAINPAIPNSAEDGTAIGDAIYHSTLMLISADEYIKSDKKEYSVKSKIIILLTDGINNRGMEIEKAVGFAKENKIKIYSILFAGKQMQDAIEYRMGNILAQVNKLDYASKETEGKFYLAFDDKTLLDVYKDIDSLEKSQIKETYDNYFELFPFFLIAGFVLLIIEMILSQTIFRRLP